VVDLLGVLVKDYERGKPNRDRLVEARHLAGEHRGRGGVAERVEHWFNRRHLHNEPGLPYEAH